MRAALEVAGVGGWSLRSTAKTTLEARLVLRSASRARRHSGRAARHFGQFPSCGKRFPGFSNPWNFFCYFFQPLELFFEKVPIIGNVMAGYFNRAGKRVAPRMGSVECLRAIPGMGVLGSVIRDCTPTRGGGGKFFRSAAPSSRKQNKGLAGPSPKKIL